MPSVPKVLQPGVQLGTTNTVLYSQPANSHALITRLILYNTGGSARVVTVYRVPTGAVPATSNIVIGGAGGRILPGQTLVAGALAGMVLEGGESIQAIADVAAEVNATMSGYVTE